MRRAPLLSVAVTLGLLTACPPAGSGLELTLDSDVDEDGFVDVDVVWDVGVGGDIVLFANGNEVARTSAAGGAYTFDRVDLTDWLQIDLPVKLVAGQGSSRSAPVPLTVDAQTGALRRLIQDATGDTHVFGNRGHFSLTTRLPAVGADRRDQALNFLVEYAGLHGVVDPAETFVQSRADSDGPIESITFQQRLDGVVVAHSGVTVLFDRTDVIGLEVALAEGGSGSARIDAQQAVDVVAAGVTVISPPVTVWFDPSLLGMEGPTRLAWDFTTWGDPAGDHRIFVDAADGTVLLREPKVRPAATDVDIIDSYETPPVDTCWSLWSGVTVCDEDACDTDAPVDAEVLRTQTHSVYDYYVDLHDFRSFDGEDEEVEIIVRYPNGYLGLNAPNAAYLNTCDNLAFTTGNTDIEVFAHEWGHAIEVNNTGNTYSGQGAMVSEHIADVLALQFDAVEAGGVIDWVLFENALGGTRTLGVSGVLNMASLVTGGSTPTGAHGGSGIPSAAFRAFTDGGMSLDQGIPLYWGVIQHRMKSPTNLRQFRNALVAQAQWYSDEAQWGFTEADVCDIRNAYAGVGVAVDQGDLDCDGIANVADGDPDGDGVWYGEDLCPNIPLATQTDLDGDGLGDPCDPDMDGDGVPNASDSCPGVADPPVVSDSDGDGIGDHCDDSDGDGVLDVVDTCPSVPNFGDVDTDGDGDGNACDEDDDNDGVLDVDDICPRAVDSAQIDTDGDGRGDECDNCVTVPNADQINNDADADGDVCDDDDDNDGVLDTADNCPTVHNPDQADADLNGVGTYCDPSELAALESGPATQTIPPGAYAFMPLPSCTSGDCAAWGAPGTAGTVTLTSTTALQAIVIDGTGSAVGSVTSLEGGSAVLALPADEGLFYETPGGQGTSQASYTLVLLADPTAIGDISVGVQLDIP